MFIEIEETVCFVASFMYGNIPRSRIDSFAEILANGLAARIYESGRPIRYYKMITNIRDEIDSLIIMATQGSFIALEELESVLPAFLIIELRQGAVHAINGESGYTKSVYPIDVQGGGSNDSSPRNSRGGRCLARRRPLFHVEFSYPRGVEEKDTAIAKPIFEVERSDQICTAQSFVVTRFGSTKIKTYQNTPNSENGLGNHPFTMPSAYAYLRLLVFLNAITCVSMIQDMEEEGESEYKEKEEPVEEKELEEEEQAAIDSEDEIAMEKKRLSMDNSRADRSSSGFVDDDAISDPFVFKSDKSVF